MSAKLRLQKVDPGRRLGLSVQRQLQWLKCGPIQVKTGGVYRKEPRSTTEVPLLMCMPKWMDGACYSNLIVKVITKGAAPGL